MKKNIGNALALYPTPLVVVGAMVDGKPNWLLVGHVGILGHDHVMVSLSSAHYTNKGIKESKKLSINLVDEALLPQADKTGCVSGSKEDKSQLFAYTLEKRRPCPGGRSRLHGVQRGGHLQHQGLREFHLHHRRHLREESVLGEQGKLDYRALKPVLFELPTYQYLRTGDVIAPCMSFGKAQA